jgi:hypothetical protein
LLPNVSGIVADGSQLTSARLALMAYSLCPAPREAYDERSQNPKTEILVVFDKKADKEGGIRK